MPPVPRRIHQGTARIRDYGAAPLTRNEQPDAATGNHPDQNRGARRRSRSIRFSDSEWTLIEQAAARQGLAAAELVRASARALAEEKPSEQSPDALSPGHIALIEATWRAVHVLATLATRQMPYQDIDDLVGESHNAMRQTMTDDPDRADPGEAPSDVLQKRRGKARRARGGGRRSVWF